MHLWRIVHRPEKALSYSRSALAAHTLGLPSWWFFIEQTRERCSGLRRGLSGSAECPLHADGSIGSVRGLGRPQTTIDAPSVVDLSAQMCSRSRRERFFLSDQSHFPLADVNGNRISRIRTAPPPGEGDGPGGVAARFAMVSSVETAATEFNDWDGRSQSVPELAFPRESSQLEQESSQSQKVKAKGERPQSSKTDSKQAD
ncbi:hypothetical protein THAOC_13264 [Thalassiosira oceanica]|uniref:Uncharacterized protein n=1 Tax=Thalassiosira oceanica TaxID=159749 RepID=K0SKJ1_THAOC|nr:hypothetical protein THAOC_13264 [Thalassiosira oceanica]|eukprot:EJK65840.1 hypothetical protein THAOC_13264 [Thalassiosira oceanica]